MLQSRLVQYIIKIDQNPYELMMLQSRLVPYIIKIDQNLYQLFISILIKTYNELKFTIKQHQYASDAVRTYPICANLLLFFQKFCFIQQFSSWANTWYIDPSNSCPPPAQCHAEKAAFSVLLHCILQLYTIAAVVPQYTLYNFVSGGYTLIQLVQLPVRVAFVPGTIVCIQ